MYYYLTSDEEIKISSRQVHFSLKKKTNNEFNRWQIAHTWKNMELYQCLLKNVYILLLIP